MFFAVNFSILNLDNNVISSYSGSRQEELPSRIIIVSDHGGGFWYDDFENTLGIQEISNVQKYPEGYSLNREYFHEDFESYYNSQDLFATANWTRHTPFNAGTFMGDTTRPNGALTQTIGNHYNPSTDTHSVALSKKFLAQSGIFEIWTGTNKIDPDHASTTNFWLMGVDRDDPSGLDRIFSAHFTSSGYDVFTGEFRDVVEDLSINTWYRIVVHFNCTVEKGSIYVYDSSGTLLGSLLDFDYFQSFPSVKRVRLMCGYRNQGTYMNSFWDDMTLVDKEPDQEGHVISAPINLPVNSRWSCLKIDKVDILGAPISLEILDQNMNSIDGINYDPLGHEVDISRLNELGLRTIRLKANFISNGLRSPILKGWGVEWNETGSWSDQYLTSLKTSSSSNIEFKGRNAHLIDQSVDGTVESVQISCPRGNNWNKLYVSKSCEPPSSITISVLDAVTTLPISGFTALQSDITDLSGIDPISYPSIILRAEINDRTSTEVCLNSWSVDWFNNIPPKLLGMNGPHTVSNISRVEFLIDIQYSERFLYLLDMSVYVNKSDGPIWETDKVEDIYYNHTEGKWCFIFDPDSTPELGEYSVKIQISDSWGNTDEAVFTNIITVFNINDPPLIKGNPLMNCLEDQYFLVDFRVYDPDPDDVHTWILDTDAHFLRIDGNNGSLSGTPKNCDVGSYDVNITVTDQGGLIDHFNFILTVVNTNDPPMIISIMPGSIKEDEEFMLDLEAVDNDPTNDILFWSMETNCTFLILDRPTGVLQGTPGNDDVGLYYIVINVSDGREGFDEVEFEFEVENTNDPPVIWDPRSKIELKEDQEHHERSFGNWFADEDGDRLDINYSPTEFITIEITNDQELIIKPDSNWSGKETVTFLVADKEYNLIWDLEIIVLPVNDAPVNPAITVSKYRFREGEKITLGGYAEDPDIIYGDELEYTWFTTNRMPLGYGKIIEIGLEKGDYKITLNVTDKAGSGVETNLLLEVYHEDNFIEKYGTFLFIVVVVLSVILLSILAFYGFRKMTHDEKEKTENTATDVDEGDEIGFAGDVFSASLLGTSMPVREELPSIMVQSGGLPPAILEGQENIEELPPAIMPGIETSDNSQYLRPQRSSPSNADGFKAPPPVDVVIDVVDSTNESPHSETSNIREPSPILERGEEGPIWSPEMVEERVRSDAKGAVEMLHELNSLKNEGAISDEEYELYKRRLLRKI